MVLGKLPVPGRPTIWMIVGQGPIALAVGAGGGCLAISSHFGEINLNTRIHVNFFRVDVNFQTAIVT